MANTGIAKPQKPKRKGRSRPLPPDVTARNLAIEKQRRGEMNENFLELARMLPNIADARRLTKVLIVNKSIEHVRQQREMCLAVDSDMQELLAENRRLVSEVNCLRAQVEGPTAPVIQPKSPTETMKQLAETRNHVFGTFSAGFGDKWVEKASQSNLQTGTRSKAYDVPVSDLGRTSVQQTTSIVSPTNIQPGTEMVSRIEPLGTVYQQPEISLAPSLDTTNEASLSSSYNPIAIVNPHLSDQLLAGGSYIDGTINTDPAYWFTGLDVSIPLQQFHGENGDMLGCI
ncbi:hypothetical protein FLAG1_09419 [Fusarium langsethiae]|uniref:BHLH domain-containing protein n=1 Tax=Fusarium langsethiae TaxID=179993 RepID=A0A0N0V5J5_FUSLA|nr:hypothetical protein FLAG1_09419 [Fusarium langsethiae]GKU06054.1 unnamed protein product [Fusarium langsethiae]GKU22249.1 unnamed protein product [Fusarium langsethiae]